VKLQPRTAPETFAQPKAVSQGIERVFVGGAPAYRTGHGAIGRNGSFLRRAR